LNFEVNSDLLLLGYTRGCI